MRDNQKSIVFSRILLIIKSSPVFLGKFIQTLGYLLIYILAIISSIFFSILFWNPNVKVDPNSFCGFDLNLLLTDINGIILLLFIIAIEGFKINDSLTILRLKNKNTHIHKLLKIFLILSIIASISFFTINSNIVKESLNIGQQNNLDKLLNPENKTPIETMINVVSLLINKKDLKLIILILLNSIYSIIIEIVILSIPKRLKVIWKTCEVIESSKKVKLKNTKVMKNLYKVINSKILKLMSSKPTEKRSLVINKVINEDEKSYTEKGKVINLQKEVINKGKKVYKEPKLSKELLKISNEVINYMEKLSKDEKIEIKPIEIQKKFNIDHNKWLKLRKYFIYHNICNASDRKTFYINSKLKKGVVKK